MQTERSIANHTALIWKDKHIPDSHSLISAIFSMVQGNALAVLSFDSAPFRPSDEEKEQGWTTVEKASVITTLETIDQVPLADFTELMFFETQPDTLPEPLVNEHGFDPTVANWDAHIILRLRSINPKLWILDGDTISTICRDAGILQLLRSIR